MDNKRYTASPYFDKQLTQNDANTFLRSLSSLELKALRKLFGIPLFLFIVSKEAIKNTTPHF